MRAIRSASRCLFAAFLLAMGARATPSHAHVVLKDATAPPKSYYVATFRVPHGCGASATTGLRVTIPNEIAIARPMPKPGWRLEVTTEPRTGPVSGGHMTAMGRIVEIAWSGGSLPADWFDEFSIMVFLPARTGPLHFPTVQVCETGEVRWTDVPPAGSTIKDVPFPPPTVTLVAPPPTNKE